VVKHWTLESPNSDTINANPSFFLSRFSLSRFQRSRCRGTCLPDSRIPIYQNSDTLARLTFQHLPTSVGTSDFAISRILMQKVRDFTPRNSETRQRGLTPCQWCATCPPRWLLWPHTTLLVFGISCFMISRFPLPSLRDFHRRKPDTNIHV
jgi:hypothetical protein